MLSLSRRQFSAGALTEMVVFAACCISTMLLAVLLHLGPYGVPSQSVFIPAVEFAAIMTSLGVIFALFRVGEPKSLTVVFIRTHHSCAGSRVSDRVCGVRLCTGRIHCAPGSRVRQLVRVSERRADQSGRFYGARIRCRVAADTDCW